MEDMSLESGEEEEESIEFVMEVQSVQSTEDPPMEEWSSLLIENAMPNVKRLAYERGMYDPGSGEICLKTIAQSDSFVMRHPYYSYPAILDPGIHRALYKPPEQYIYPADGEELYFDLCKEMNLCPVGLFHKNLTNSVINLSFYSVAPDSVRAMSLALENNLYVRELDLTENYLNDDGCYHLGRLLEVNRTIESIDLTGCHIGCSGLIRILHGAIHNSTFKILNLDRNQLSDPGGIALGEAFHKGLDLDELSLSYNGICSKGISAMAHGMHRNNGITRLDLSWNNLYSPDGTCDFLKHLRKNKNLEWLNLSWNGMSGPELGAALQKVLTAPKLAYIDLSNNKLNGDGIGKVGTGISRAKSLVYVDISNNPLSLSDAMLIAMKVKLAKSKIKTFKMENINVDNGVVKTLGTMKSLDYSHGYIVRTKKLKGPDPREVILNRANIVVTKKNKKCSIAQVVMQLVKDGEEVMDFKYFGKAVKDQTGAGFEEGLLDQIAKCFPGPRSKKTKFIKLPPLLDYVKRKWPDAKLPPTPPPEPEPPKVKDTGKGKGKK